METGEIPPYELEDEIENLMLTPDKPSAHILKTKIGAKVIQVLRDIKSNHNHSWYREVYERSKKCRDKVALFYRANKITYQEMFDRADALAMSLAKQGLKKGDKLPCCMANTPELVYLMLAANKLGITLQLLGTNLDKEYARKIIAGSTRKVFFCTDDNYHIYKDLIKEEGFEKNVVVSLADSLPEHPEKCDEYEPELDKYYRYENKAKIYKETDPSISLFGEYTDYGKDYTGEIIDDNDLYTTFTETFTGGSTRIGFPKVVRHANRSYIIGGVFNDSNLTGSPSVEEIRGMAHIHSDSNTNLVTAISDNLMKCGSVALEPEYGKFTLLDAIFMNKPVHLDATTSQLVQAAKDYLVGLKFKGRKLKKMLVTMAVGEPAQPGEEKFINKFLRKVKAGSEIKLGKITLPYGPLSTGGGDCEHGGIYYTLLKGLQRVIHAVKSGFSPKKEYGMTPVPFATVTALKQLPDGSWEECNYDESGIIVANSITTMQCYGYDKERTVNKIIRDRYGRDWVSCDVFGYVNTLGNAVVKGRIEDVIKVTDNVSYPNYLIDDVVTLDTKNIMSCSTVCVNTDAGDVPVVNIEFSPLMNESMKTVLLSMDERCKKLLPDYIYERLVYRVMSNSKSYPLTASEKRSIVELQKMGLENILNIDSVRISSYGVDEHKSLVK